jgi:hypothetical protein
MIERVLTDLKLKEKDLQPFEVTDPMHPQNTLKGFISRKSDHRYGAVVITHINGKEAYQVHYATPKQHYPFGRDGRYCFPKAKEIEVYEKLDGTNVCAYRYYFEDQVFQTYKLRLFPVLRNSKWGNFLDFWKEMMEKYPQVADICAANDCNVSFELYGSRNTHLIVYDVPLEIALLFGVDRGGGVISPSKMEHSGIPTARLLATITSGKELAEEYNRFREEIEKSNKENPDETIKGAEGVVWYLQDEKGTITQFKCKPESIETIHWGTGAIDVNAIKATAHNVLETEDTITYEATVELLKEEFSDEQVELSEARIRKVVEGLREWYEFQKKVMDIYESIGVNFHEDKGTVMRAMSKHFPKSMMKRVGFIMNEMPRS